MATNDVVRSRTITMDITGRQLLYPETATGHSQTAPTEFLKIAELTCPELV